MPYVPFKGPVMLLIVGAVWSSVKVLPAPGACWLVALSVARERTV